MGNSFFRRGTDVEAQEEIEYLFSDVTIRQRFLRKVFCIVFIQLCIICSLMTLFIFVDELQIWVYEHTWVRWIFLGTSLVCMLMISCCEAPRRTVPYNYILLLIYTLSIGMMFAVWVAFMKAQLVLMAAGTTGGIVLVLTLIALFTKIDFTKYYMYMLVILLVFVIFGIIMIFIRNKITFIVYCALGVLIFSVWLLIDIQMMLGGNHMLQISPEDYVLAAMCITADIMNIFAHVLGLFSATD